MLKNRSKNMVPTKQMLLSTIQSVQSAQSDRIGLNTLITLNAVSNRPLAVAHAHQ